MLLIPAPCTSLFLSSLDDHTSSRNGDAMSGPSARPSVYHGHSWSRPGLACAHTRYCPLQPSSPTLCSASGSVQRPAPSSSVLGALGSPEWPARGLGQLEPCPGSCAASVPGATCRQHTWPLAAHHIALCPATGQVGHSEPLEETCCVWASGCLHHCGHRAWPQGGVRGWQDMLPTASDPIHS